MTTFYVAITVDRDPTYNLDDLGDDLRRGRLNTANAEFEVYGDYTDLVAEWARRWYMDQDVNDPEWTALCEEVQRILPKSDVAREVLVDYLQRSVFGSWASERRIKRLANGSFVNQPRGAKPNPIVGKDNLRRLIAAAKRGGFTQENV